MQTYIIHIRVNKTKMLKSHPPNVKSYHCFNFTKFTRNWIAFKLADQISCQLCLQSCHLAQSVTAVYIIETSE